MSKVILNVLPGKNIYYSTILKNKYENRILDSLVSKSSYDFTLFPRLGWKSLYLFYSKSWGSFHTRAILASKL